MSTSEPHGGVGAVTVTQAAELQAGDGAGSAALLVDVREVGEFAALRAPGAVLVPLSSFAARISDLPRDRQLLMICRSGVRSRNAGSLLVQHGFSDVANVEGGMIAWQQAGLPTRSGPPEPGEGELSGR
jgi:rhodanese-related sulfurtransferase